MYLFNPNVYVHSIILYTARKFYREGLWLFSAAESHLVTTRTERNCLSLVPLLISSLASWFVHGSDFAWGSSGKMDEGGKFECGCGLLAGLTDILRDFPPQRP